MYLFYPGFRFAAPWANHIAPLQGATMQIYHQPIANSSIAVRSIGYSSIEVRGTVLEEFIAKFSLAPLFTNAERGEGPGMPSVRLFFTWREGWVPKWPWEKWGVFVEVSEHETHESLASDQTKRWNTKFSGLGFMACERTTRPIFFSALIFWFVLYQDKMNGEYRLK